MLKKIALLVVMFALPLGAMAQAKFAHMNSQEVITVMPEFTKAQADLDAMSKKYQDEMQRTNEEFQKKYQEYLVQQDSLPKWYIAFRTHETDITFCSRSHRNIRFRIWWTDYSEQDTGSPSPI